MHRCFHEANIVVVPCKRAQQCCATLRQLQNNRNVGTCCAKSLIGCFADSFFSFSRSMFLKPVRMLILVAVLVYFIVLKNGLLLSVQFEFNCNNFVPLRKLLNMFSPNLTSD